MVVNKTINSKSVISIVEKCYADYCNSVPVGVGLMINGFRYHLEKTAGLRLHFGDNLYISIRNISDIEIVDEPKYAFWLLKWS